MDFAFFVPVYLPNGAAAIGFTEGLALIFVGFLLDLQFFGKNLDSNIDNFVQ
ncbi:hypothetical protein D3C83_67950 [compost metagenome]